MADEWADGPRTGTTTMRRPAPGECVGGGKCGGTRWIKVQAAYADRVVKRPEVPRLDATDAELEVYDREARAAELMRIAALNTYYPCRDCAVRAFFRWAAGHYEPDHRRSPETCKACADDIEKGRVK